MTPICQLGKGRREFDSRAEPHGHGRVGVFVSIGILVLGGCCAEVPKQEKLAVCTTNRLDFTMEVHYSPPYQFILGLPHSQTNQISFRGEMILQQSTGVVARVSINSRDMVPCSWLDSSAGLAGYILTWSRTNRSERLSKLLSPKQRYNVHVTFEEAPPSQSSLWFSSMSKAGF